MKLVKASAIAVAVSALLVVRYWRKAPHPTCKMRGGAKKKTKMKAVRRAAATRR